MGCSATAGLLDRWAGEATGLAQSAAEELVATRVLSAESALTAAMGAQDEVESTRVAEQISVIDSELREHSVVGARAAALRGREMPTLLAALEAVRTDLGEPPTPDEAKPEAESDDTGTASETSAPADADDAEIDETSPTNAPEEAF